MGIRAANRWFTAMSGVRSVWGRGQWRVKLLFMDHDDLHVMGTTAEAFQPRPYLHGMQADAHHIARLTGDLQDAGETLHMGLLAQSVPGAPGNLEDRPGGVPASVGLGIPGRHAGGDRAASGPAPAV